MPNLPQELDELYRTRRQSLYTLALSVTGRQETAEDAIQDAFYRLYRLRNRPRNLEAYVWRSVRNAAIDHLRRTPPGQELLNEYIFDPAPGPAEQTQDRLFRQRVAAALLQIGQDERETIVQHLYVGLSFREIAGLRHVPLGTVTSWYQRGIRRLRSHLEE